jgi:[acyl-carrier-protein] S-malonyltransferase
MIKTAWVFPGQGSQNPGMTTDLADLPFAQAKFQQAQEILGWDVAQVCLNNKLELSQTFYTQPCLYVVSTILTDLMKNEGFHPSIVAGHSLGEYAALYAAEVIDFETGLQLVKRRAELMATAPQGVMVALVGFNRDSSGTLRDRIQQQVDQTSDVVIANDNHNNQVVISGTATGVNTVLANIKVRRTVPLDVSGAFHSPLMTQVSLEFNQILQNVTFQPAKVPVISNVEPSATTEALILKERLMQQMTGQVRWREIIECLIKEGVERVVEIGPGLVLSNTILRMYPDMDVRNIDSNMAITMLQQSSTSKLTPQQEVISV